MAVLICSMFGAPAPHNNGTPSRRGLRPTVKVTGQASGISPSPRVMTGHPDRDCERNTINILITRSLLKAKTKLKIVVP